MNFCFMAKQKPKSPVCSSLVVGPGGGEGGGGGRRGCPSEVFEKHPKRYRVLFHGRGLN